MMASLKARYVSLSSGGGVAGGVAGGVRHGGEGVPPCGVSPVDGVGEVEVEDVEEGEELRSISAAP